MSASEAAMNEALIAIALSEAPAEIKADLCAKLHRLAQAIGVDIGGTTSRVRVLSILAGLCHQAETAGRHHDLMAGVEVEVAPVADRLIAAGLAEVA